MPDDWESPRRRWGDPPGSQKGAWRAPPPGRARHPPRCPVAPLGAPFRLYNPSGVETPKEDLLSRYATATGRKPTEEKTHLRRGDSAGEITSRKGDRRHHHHHHHGHHRDHHQHHPQHQHHLHLHPISSHNCNLCCNPYYLPPLLCWCWLLLCGECYWVLLEKYYCVQIVHHLFITSDHDLFYVLWVVTLVLENMGAV